MLNEFIDQKMSEYINNNGQASYNLSDLARDLMNLSNEAKYESNEGLYPSSEKEKNIFRKRGIKYVGQRELQKYMMEELLGIKTDFIYLVFKKEKVKSHKIISWAEVFGSLDVNGIPRFAIEMVRNISAINKEDYISL